MSKQTDIKKQMIDQSAHFIVAFAIVSLAYTVPHAITGFVIGLTIGIIREVTEEGSPVSWAKLKKACSGWSCLDLAFWGFGGMVAGWLFA